MDSRNFERMTVAELIKVLGEYPSDTKISCCGIEYIWLNYNEEDKYLVIDTENLAESDIY